LLVPRLCLGTQIRRLCLLFFSPIDEAEPLDISSQAEPRNQLLIIINITPFLPPFSSTNYGFES
jgi:hypothetical protein